MFQDVGNKIKNAASIVLLIGISASVIWGLYLLGEGGGAFGILFIAGGSLVSWLSALLLHGFGDLIDNTRRIAEKMDEKTAE